MARIANKDVYRVTLDFSKESQEYIEALQKQANCSTKAEVFKQALNVFDFIVNELAKGNKFMVVGPKNQKREVLFPLFISRNGNNKNDSE
jgi:hypothetical protein